MVEGKKKNIRIVVRDYRAAAAPPSQCMEQQLFFDPFVMVSMQPGTAWLLSHEQAPCHRQSVCIRSLSAHVHMPVHIQQHLHGPASVASVGWFHIHERQPGGFLSAPFSFVGSSLSPHRRSPLTASAEQAHLISEEP